MSINSKARRDARRRQQARKPADARAAPIPAHAHLLDAEGRIVGGVGLRGAEWALVLAGRVVTTTDSAGMAIAMVNRVAAASPADAPLQSRCSEALHEAAAREAEASGQTLEHYLAALEAERIEHLEKKRRESPSGSVH